MMFPGMGGPGGVPDTDEDKLKFVFARYDKDMDGVWKLSEATCFKQEVHGESLGPDEFGAFCTEWGCGKEGPTIENLKARYERNKEKKECTRTHSGSHHTHTPATLHRCAEVMDSTDSASLVLSSASRSSVTTLSALSEPQTLQSLGSVSGFTGVNVVSGINVVGPPGPPERTRLSKVMRLRGRRCSVVSHDGAPPDAAPAPFPPPAADADADVAAPFDPPSPPPPSPPSPLPPTQQQQQQQQPLPPPPPPPPVLHARSDFAPLDAALLTTPLRSDWAGLGGGLGGVGIGSGSSGGPRRRCGRLSPLSETPSGGGSATSSSVGSPVLRQQQQQQQQLQQQQRDSPPFARVNAMVLPPLALQQPASPQSPPSPEGAHEGTSQETDSGSDLSLSMQRAVPPPSMSANPSQKHIIEPLYNPEQLSSFTL